MAAKHDRSIDSLHLLAGAYCWLGLLLQAYKRTDQAWADRNLAVCIAVLRLILMRLWQVRSKWLQYIKRLGPTTQGLAAVLHKSNAR